MSVAVIQTVQEEPALARLRLNQEFVYVLLVHCQGAAATETVAQEESASERVQLQQDLAHFALL
jgi:hypothetical protein